MMDYILTKIIVIGMLHHGWFFIYIIQWMYDCVMDKILGSKIIDEKLKKNTKFGD
jgi:hypothetical protein